MTFNKNLTRGLATAPNLLFDCFQPSKEFIMKNIEKIIKEKQNIVKNNISEKTSIMEGFNNPHHLIYSLFLSPKEVKKMEYYWNLGRIISSNSGQMFDTIIKFLLSNTIPGKSTNINNPKGHPKYFEIDHLDEINKVAYEVKWRDAGTDGDHLKKEFNKVDAVLKLGYKPIRLTFFMPELKQSNNSQKKIIEYYKNNGEAYTGNDAFKYVKSLTGYDLKKMFDKYKKV